MIKILSYQLTLSETLTERWWRAKEFCCEVFLVCCGSCVQWVIMWVAR